MAFSHKWTEHLKTQEEKDNFYRDVRSAKPVLDRLRDMVDQKLESMSLQELSTANYEKASWPYYQAHQNGFRQFATVCKMLINLDQKEETTNDSDKSIRI